MAARRLPRPTIWSLLLCLTTLWACQSPPAPPAPASPTAPPPGSPAPERSSTSPPPASSPAALWVTNLNGQLFRVDPATHTLSAPVDVSFSPGHVAAGAGALWVASSRVATADSFAAVLSRIDPVSRLAGPALTLDQSPNDIASGIAAGVDAVWVIAPVLDEAGNAAGGKLFRIDPQTGQIVAVVALGASPRGVAAGPDAVWIASGSGVVIKVDPATNQVAASLPTGPGSFPEDILAAASGVWVADTAHVLRIDPAAVTITTRTTAGTYPSDLAADDNAVWVANQGDGTVARIDPSSGQVTATIKAGDFASSVAAGPGVVWVAANTAGMPQIVRIDPASGQVIATIPIAGGVSDIAVGP